jgi:hypothetical protein
MFRMSRNSSSNQDNIEFFAFAIALFRSSSNYWKQVVRMHIQAFLLILEGKYLFLITKFLLPHSLPLSLPLSFLPSFFPFSLFWIRFFLCSPNWTQTPDPPASASQVLGLQDVIHIGLLPPSLMWATLLFFNTLFSLFSGSWEIYVIYEYWIFQTIFLDLLKCSCVV